MKKITLLAALLLLCVGSARGQCSGYTITSTQVNLLSPSDYAAQGNVAVTLNFSGLDGSNKSHKSSAGIGTDYNVNWRAYNTTSVDFSFSFDGGNTWTHLPNSYTSGNGNGMSFEQQVYQGWPVGKTYILRLTGTGPNGTSTDRASIYIPSSSPGFTFQDGVPTNAYYQHVTIFGGGSMMNQCGECQGGETQHCLQATHTPYFDATMTNPQSGETQTISNASAGNVATATESVNGTSGIGISVLPGDHPTGTTTDKIYCTMFGWIMAQQWNPGIPDFEWAITEEEVIPSSCTLVLRFFEQNSDWGVQCNVAWKKPPATADRCTLASQTPDFQPDSVWDEQDCKIPGDCGTADLPPPNGTNQNYPKYWYAASSGVRFGGPPAPGEPDPVIAGGAHGWKFPVYVLKGYLPGGPDEDWWILDLLNLAVAKGTGLPIDCTNRDKGTSPIQSPW